MFCWKSYFSLLFKMKASICIFISKYSSSTQNAGKYFWDSSGFPSLFLSGGRRLICYSRPVLEIWSERWGSGWANSCRSELSIETLRGFLIFFNCFLVPSIAKASCARALNNWKTSLSRFFGSAVDFLASFGWLKALCNLDAQRN